MYVISYMALLIAELLDTRKYLYTEDSCEIIGDGMAREARIRPFPVLYKVVGKKKILSEANTKDI